MFKSSTFLFFLTVSVANCQFFYNYEEDRPNEPQPQNYDQSAYQENPLSDRNEEYVQPPITENQPRNERTQIRVRSRHYSSDQNYNEPQPPTFVSADITRERRKAKIRQQQRQNNYLTEPVVPVKVYGPSVFENIGLGEAPSGVYIPQNSFLNVLRNPSQGSMVQRPVSLSAPQPSSYVQSSIGNVNSGLQSEFFVQPPSNAEATQPNLMLPISRSRVESNNVPLPQTAVIPNRNPSVVRTRTVRRRKQSRPRIRLQPEYANPPTVDIDALREYSDDFDRAQEMPQVQYVPANIRQNTRSQNRRRITNYQETTPAPIVYSPSVFEKIELGEAPRGIYVPDDSLLNVLRNPSSSSRVSQQEPIVNRAYLPPMESEEQYQPTSSRRRSPQNSRQTAPLIRSPVQEYPEEYEDYQNVQPTSSRRRSHQNSRPTAPLTRSSSQGFQDEYVDYQNVQPNNQRQSQRGGDGYEIQKPPVRRQRKPVAVSMPRTQPQTAVSERSQSSMKTAKLAVAELPQDRDDDNIPGEAGVDYPTFHVIPKTSFSCSQQSHNGYYADLETSCQVVHLCQAGGVQNSFLCPNGTIFSQEKFSCQWWYKVNCNDAPNFYIKNDELYKVPIKQERKRN